MIPGAPAGGAPSLGAPVTVLKGVTEAMRKRLEHVGVVTVADLVHFYPRRHDDFSHTVDIVFLKEDASQTVKARLERVQMRRTRRSNRAMVEAYFSDDSGRMKVIWFNQPFVVKQVEVGDVLVLSGKVKREGPGQGVVMINPAFERERGAGLHTARLVPVYRETTGLTSRWIRPRVAEALAALPQLRDVVPEPVLDRNDLPDLESSIRQVHFPSNGIELARARRGLAFRQLLVIRLAVAQNRSERQREVAPAVPYDVDTARAMRDALPFQLTDAQRKAAHAIFTDMAEPHPMARLLQGDVGSGKTAVAAMASAMVAHAGLQTLLMAPTEILAQQHARTLKPHLDALGIEMDLLVGSTPAAARRKLLAGLESGELRLVVGTHALIEQVVRPDRLGLVIVDEQHRFGVAQRHALARKGAHPHVLSMTATPIPRTLQLTVYGDLAVSVLDEMPPGRVPVETRMVRAPQRQAAYDFVAAQVAEGRQAFVICPLVEASEVLQVRNATDEYERLRTEVFPGLRLALLHGRMKPRDKDEVMTAFKAGEYDVLVSTSVVEVGVDVPNATVMMIEAAERFGLAQLHQFRGRVGRGAHAAVCLLLSDTENPEENRRLQAMERYSSGFDLAEVDLEIRGPGDVFGGSAQSGQDGVMVAGLHDARLIEIAATEADRLAAEGLERYPGLQAQVDGFFIAGSFS